MILSDQTIEEHLEYPNFKETIGVTPEPTDDQIQPASLDVRLGGEFARSGRDGFRTFERDSIILAPGKRYLGTTAETIDLPDSIAAQLAGRSSIGRKGIIVHKTAGWIDPGFIGEITLELMNLGDQPVELEKGDRIAQLVFFKLDKSSSGYDGHYQNQSGATEAYHE